MMTPNSAPLPSTPRVTPSPFHSLLARLGLERREIRAWAMYDWAVSSFQTTIQVAVFQIFFVSVAAATLPGSRPIQAWANANIIASIIVAVISPILGAISDVAAAKQRMLAIFMGIGDQVTVEVAAEYAAEDADITLQLHEAMSSGRRR